MKNETRVRRSTRNLILEWLYGNTTCNRLSSVEPEELLFAVRGYRLEAHLLWRMQQLSQGEGSNPGACDRIFTLLKLACLRNAALNLQMDTLARQMCAKLHAEQIPVLLLKGAALRARYPELAGRPQCDTDLLVGRADLERAEAILVEAGYRVDEKSMTREEYLHEHFDLRMVKGGNSIELHWAMSNECAPGAVERTWERAEKIDWGGTPVWIPSVEDQLVFTQVHLCRHLFSRGLRWLGDMVFEVECWPDLEPRLRTVKQDWPGRFVAASLAVAQDLGLRPGKHPVPTCEVISRLDRLVLCSLARSMMVGEKWYGVPGWNLNPALECWLTQEEDSLARALIQVLGSRIVSRTFRPFLPHNTLPQ